METLTFVAIHELSHVMSIDIGHGDEFWTNFKFLLENAEDAGIYKMWIIKIIPKIYGMKITDNLILIMNNVKRMFYFLNHIIYK